MSGTLYTRPTLRDKAENALVLAAAIAGRVWWWAVDNVWVQVAFGAAFYIALIASVFTSTGQEITAHILAIGFSLWNGLGPYFGLPRLDVGGVV